MSDKNASSKYACDLGLRHVAMTYKQLTKMCDQYLAELAVERQRARLPDELVARLRTAIEFDLQEQFGGDLVKRLIEDVLAWQAQQQQEDGK